MLAAVFGGVLPLACQACELSKPVFEGRNTAQHVPPDRPGTVNRINRPVGSMAQSTT
jgi:hypothetical protein